MINRTLFCDLRAYQRHLASVLAVVLAAAIGLGGGLGGCAATKTAPYTPQAEVARNPLEAQKLTQQACKVVGENDERAEELLREALTADLYYGPAHNNLGAVYLRQGKLYEAAGEFEWSRKLMPGNPEPRMNLALTLERAGRTGEALETYAAALQVQPEHIESMQALARLQLRSGKTDERTPVMLKEIAMRGTSDRWKEWAARQLTRAGI